MPLSGLMGYPLIISMLGSTLFISPHLVLLHLAATLPSHLQLQVQQSVGEPCCQPPLPPSRLQPFLLGISAPPLLVALWQNSLRLTSNPIRAPVFSQQIFHGPLKLVLTKYLQAFIHLQMLCRPRSQIKPCSFHLYLDLC